MAQDVINVHLAVGLIQDMVVFIIISFYNKIKSDYHHVIIKHCAMCDDGQAHTVFRKGYDVTVLASQSDQHVRHIAA